MKDYVRVSIIEVTVVRLGPLFHAELFNPPYLYAGMLPCCFPCLFIVTGMLSDLFLELYTCRG